MKSLFRLTFQFIFYFLNPNLLKFDAHYFLNRSTSSVTDRRPKTRPPIAKPVRRSKSQHISAYKGGSFVTSIQHGGSVTLVSLGGEHSANGPSRTDQVKYIIKAVIS